MDSFEDVPEPLLPGYLREPTSTATFGTLSYNRKAKCWTIKGEPCVTELAKRLFPGCDGRGRGVARFTAHRRMVGELNWLMLRYPLDIAPRDQARWEDSLEDARRDALRRQAALRRPQKAEPSADFCGTLMDFQKEGLAFLQNNPRALLADEMGLGKTVQALAFLTSAQAFPVLLVVPPHLMFNWQREIARFVRVDGREPIVRVLKGLKPYDPEPADVYIIHYLLLRGWKTKLPSLGFSSVVFDEIQELRHSGTEKYSAASLLSSACETVIGLSGTPIYNHGGEIWNVVNILDFHFLGDFESFSREWCYGYGNQIVQKPDVLGAHLRREGLMLRRTKQDVLPELPPKRRLVQEIDANDALYLKLIQPARNLLEELSREENPARRSILLSALDQTRRQAAGIAKAEDVCAFTAALLESGQRVLLFAHHHQVMDMYRVSLKRYKPVFVTGRETALQKEAACNAFTQKKTDLCVISLRAASGLNLQTATCVVFGELDWSPAVHAQAEDRAHRIGQVDSLLCYYLIGKNGSDAMMLDALGLKISQFVALMGDTPPDAEQTQLHETLARQALEAAAQQLEHELFQGASSI